VLAVVKLELFACMHTKEHHTKSGEAEDIKLANDV